MFRKYAGRVAPSTDFPGRTGRPSVTSRAEVLRGARLIIDRDGWDRLTVRRLAAELRIGPTTLYRHVGGKQDLLVMLLDEHIRALPRPDLPTDPQERILVAALAVRDVLTDWPWVVEVLATDGFVGLLDDSALWPVEAIVAAAVEHGCTDAQAVDLFRSIWYFTLGEVLVRTRSARARDRQDHPTARADFEAFDSASLPRLAAIGSRWPELAVRDVYSRGLRALVDGLLDE